jgi:hypothetical protein
LFLCQFQNDYIADLAPIVVWTPPAASDGAPAPAADDRSRGIVVGASGTGLKSAAKAAAAAAASAAAAAASASASEDQTASAAPAAAVTAGRIPDDLRVGSVPAENAGAGAAVEGGARQNASQVSDGRATTPPETRNHDILSLFFFHPSTINS